MEIINRFVEDYKIKRKERNKQRLEKKYTVKTFSDAWQSVNLVTYLSGFTFQTVSLVTASVYMIYTVYTQTGSIYAGAAVALALLFGVEALKRLCIKPTFKNFFQFREVSYFLVIFVICCCSLSVYLSYNGAPLVSKYFAPKPELIDIDQIKAAQASKMDSMHAHWNGLINASIAEVKGFEDKNTIKTGKDKGLIYWGQNENLADLQKATTKHRADYATASTLLSEFHQKEINEAKAENKARSATANTEQRTTGEFMALLTLLLELLTVAAIGFNEYYDYRSMLELEDEMQQTKTQTSLNIEAVATASSAKVQQPQRAVVKGFGAQPTEGDIQSGLIWYQSSRAAGWKKRSDLTRYRAAAGSAKRKKRIEQLINKLDEQA